MNQVGLLKTLNGRVMEKNKLRMIFMFLAIEICDVAIDKIGKTERGTILDD